MSKIPNFLEMLKAGVHFGHQKSRWHPKMKPYIFGVRNGVQIINLEKTVEELERTLNFVKTLASNGKVILFVGTKRQAREIVKSAAEACGMPYLVERWIGGMLTNFPEVKRRLKKYANLKEQVKSGEIERYTKKEQLDIKREIEKMDKYLIGLTKLEKVPDALYIADMRTEKTAIAEAKRTGVTIVGVCDTNVNPLDAEYVIPANDDAVNSIKMIAGLVTEAVSEGAKELEKKKLAIVKEEKKVEVPKKEKRALKKEESL